MSLGSMFAAAVAANAARRGPATPPTRDTWVCERCDVRWTDVGRECWVCGRVDEVITYRAYIAKQHPPAPATPERQHEGERGLPPAVPAEPEDEDEAEH